METTNSFITACPEACYEALCMRDETGLDKSTDPMVRGQQIEQGSWDAPRFIIYDRIASGMKTDPASTRRQA